MLVEVSSVEWWLRDSGGVLISLCSCYSTSLSKLVRVHATWCTIAKHVLMSACLLFRYWLGWLRSVGHRWLLLSSCPYLQLRHSFGSWGCPPPTPTCKVWERHRLLILTRDGPIIINSLIFTEASHYYNKLLMFMKLYIGCPCCHFVLKYECVYDAFWNVWSF